MRYIVLFFILFAQLLTAQDLVFTGGFLPETGFTFSLSKKIQFTTKVESFHRVYYGSRLKEPGEYYAVISEEPIYSIQDGVSDLENRFTFVIGKYFTKLNKLEWGLDYRTDKFLMDGFRHTLWIKIGWFINI